MRALTIIPRAFTALTLFVGMTGLTGCQDSVTRPFEQSPSRETDSALNADGWRRTAVINSIEVATYVQLQALAACLPSGSGLPQPPRISRNPTLAEVVALTPQIQSWKTAVVEYVQTLSLDQVVAMTPCIRAALTIVDGSGGSDGNREAILAALQAMPLIRFPSVGACLTSSSLPPAPDIDPDSSLGELTRRTPELAAYRDAVMAHLGGLSLGEIVALTPCLVKAGVPIS